MKRSNERIEIPRALAASLLMLLALIGRAAAQQAETETPLATITFTQPDGSQDIVGEGEDFATVELGDPWDMNEPSDIWLSRNVTNERWEDGAYKANTTTSSYLYLLWQGYPQAQNVGKTGQAHPIDADKYHRVSVALCSNNTGTMYFYWFRGVGTSDPIASDVTYIYPGCGLYVYDMHDLDGPGREWDDEINGFRLDPKVANGSISIYWVRLTADPTADERYPIGWQGLSPSGTGQILELFIDSNRWGQDGWRIHSLLNPPTTGSYTWGVPGLPALAPPAEWPTPADVEAGSYYVYAKVSGGMAGYSSASVQVSHLPQLVFTDPSYTSGPDYATEVLGDPWDMNGPSDVEAFTHFASYSFVNGQLHLANTSHDPRIELHVTTPIDTDRYRFLTVRSNSDRERNVDHGTVARAIWHSLPFNPTLVGTIENIILLEGWQTYSVDLAEALLVPGSKTWESRDWPVLRWDPNENTTGELWLTIIDDIKLTGYPEADGNFQVQWALDNPEDEEVTVRLYYDVNNWGCNGILIGQHTTPAAQGAMTAPASPASAPQGTYRVYLPLVNKNTCPGNCLFWETSAVPAGKYYVYARVDDGVNQLCRYSQVPVLVK